MYRLDIVFLSSIISTAIVYVINYFVNFVYILSVEKGYGVLEIAFDVFLKNALLFLFFFVLMYSYSIAIELFIHKIQDYRHIIHGVSLLFMFIVFKIFLRYSSGHQISWEYLGCNIVGNGNLTDCGSDIVNISFFYQIFITVVYSVSFAIVYKAQFGGGKHVG